MTKITKIESVVCDNCKKVIPLGDRFYMVEIEYDMSFKVGQVIDESSDYSGTSKIFELCDNCQGVFEMRNNLNI
jgi:hypothetical protein